MVSLPAVWMDISASLSLCAPLSLCEMQVELSQAQGGHDSSVQCITVDQQYLYSADWHGCIKVPSCLRSSVARMYSVSRDTASSL